MTGVYEPQRAATQVQYPVRAALRTALAYLVGAGVVLPVAWTIAQQELSRAGIEVPAQVTTTVGLGLAALGAVVAIVTRIMAIPLVSDALTRWGIGPTPLVAVAVELTPDPAPLPKLGDDMETRGPVADSRDQTY